MSDLFWLTEEQMRRIEPYFSFSHGVPRVYDKWTVSGIIVVIRNGLRWRDAPTAYGPPKTIYIGSSAEAGWVSSTASSRGWRRQAGHRINR